MSRTGRGKRHSADGVVVARESLDGVKLLWKDTPRPLKVPLSTFENDSSDGMQPTSRISIRAPTDIDFTVEERS